VNSLFFGKGNIFNVTYNHAKWGIAYDRVSNKPEPWVCAADINREYTQRKRGGGSLCINNSVLFNKFNTGGVIESFDKDCEK